MRYLAPRLFGFADRLFLDALNSFNCLSLAQVYEDLDLADAERIFVLKLLFDYFGHFFGRLSLFVSIFHLVLLKSF